MSCDAVEHALEHHGTQGLDARLWRHARSCRHCRDVVAALETLESSLRALPVPPVRTQLDLTAETTLDTAQVLEERRAEASHLDWWRSIERVEVVPSRARFGVPRGPRSALGAQLIFASVAAVVLFTLGLIASVIYSDSQNAQEPSSVTAASVDQGNTREALDKR